MADISSLGNLQHDAPLDLNIYTDVKESSFQLPVKGRYTVRAPESFPASSFSATKAGFLAAQIDPTIVGPTNEGFGLRYIKVSAKSFPRNGSQVSMLGDYLRACGQRGNLDSPQALADAVEATAGSLYQVDLDWRAQNMTTGLEVKGMEKFPSDGNGGHQSWVPDPQDIDAETGKPRRIRARLVISRFIPVA